jgi:hypothetical protein
MNVTGDKITKMIEAYFARQSEFDGDGMLEFWHPGGMMYLVGNNNEFRIVTVEEQAAHIKETRERVPDLKVHFQIETIEQVVEHEDLIASVHVRYRMILPDGYGKHRCFYNLAKIEGKWGIVNAVDRGFQEMQAEES